MERAEGQVIGGSATGREGASGTVGRNIWINCDD